MAKGAREYPPQIRKVVIEELRLILPFNDRARNLSILNKPLWLFQREALEAMLGNRCLEEPPIDHLRNLPPHEDKLPILIHREDLFFDKEYIEAFWSQAKDLDRPCQAAFYTIDPDASPEQALEDRERNDRAFTTYALPLTKNFACGREADGRYLCRVPLWYFPNGLPEGGIQTEGSYRIYFEPIIVQSGYREAGYYSVPSFMSTELGDLQHLLPARSMLSIESWVHIYYANILFGIFAIGSRFEEHADRDWRFRLRIMLQAMLEQRQMLSCSKVVHMGRNVHIDPSVIIQGPAWIGDDVTIEAGAVITNCIIGANVSIGNDCQLFLSVVGEGCFLPFKASLFMSVLMKNSIVAQNTCLQMAVVGRNSFIGAGNTFTDFMMVPQLKGESLKANGPNGLEPTGQIVLGGCVGHNCRIGSGLVIHPARMIESDVILFSAPERRVIKRNITYEESDHHKLPAERAELHKRWDAEEDEW